MLIGINGGYFPAICRVCFTVFLRLQIYEAIAAIFWQSAIYVLKLNELEFLLGRYCDCFGGAVFRNFFDRDCSKQEMPHVN